MKLVLICTVCIALVHCQRPFRNSEQELSPEQEQSQSSDQDTTIIKYINENTGTGEYNYSVELSDGSSRHEESHWEDYGLETQHLKVSGYYEYYAPDGVKYRVDYEADKYGYQPRGDHIPAGAAPLDENTPAPGRLG